MPLRDFALENTRRVNRGWMAITAVALTTAVVGKLMVNTYAKRTEEDLSESLPPGAFVGESTVQRRSPYEGAGSSYMGRKGGDRFS